MNKHDYVALPLPKRMQVTTADIDCELAAIIRTLWSRGYRTRSCCQGDPKTDHEGVDQAFIVFSSVIEAALFHSFCGPTSWSNAQHAKRHRERPEGSERWTWDWRIVGDTVRFPNRDIGRVAKAVQNILPLRELIGAVSDPDLPLHSLAPTCPGCGMDLIRAQLGTPDPHRSAPRRCPTCGGIVLSRRKDARYCSRRCQLSARDRRRTKV